VENTKEVSNMNRFDGSAEERGRGLSRRGLLQRVGGGIAGTTLASLGLDFRRSARAQAGSLSLRDLLGRINPPVCDPSRGIRAALANNGSVISIRDLARRYAGRANLCKPMEVSLTRYEELPDGIRASFTGRNLTPSGRVDFLFRSYSMRDRRYVDEHNITVSARAQPDGTLVHVQVLGCGLPERTFDVSATDVATGRRVDLGGIINYDTLCPQPQPGTGTGTGTETSKPNITVTPEGSRYTVKGTGFLKNQDVVIRVVNHAYVQYPFYHSTRSDGEGRIEYVITYSCTPGYGISFSAHDGRTVPDSQDRTGFLWSNTVTFTCT
jgi:hypothetical protein